MDRKKENKHEHKFWWILWASLAASSEYKCPRHCNSAFFPVKKINKTAKSDFLVQNTCENSQDFSLIHSKLIDQDFSSDYKQEPYFILYVFLREGIKKIFGSYPLISDPPPSALLEDKKKVICFTCIVFE